MKMHRVWRVIFWALAACSSPASAAWHKASSDHFIIYANATEPQLRTFAERLERFDRGLRYLRKLPDDPARRSNRLIVYVVNGTAKVEKLCGAGCGDVAGFYKPRAGGSIAVTPLRMDGQAMAQRMTTGSMIPARRPAYDKPQIILFHEYSHHFMFSNYPGAYPAWFSEGFAEFNATARFEADGALGFGIPAQHRAYELLMMRGVPIEQLLAPPVPGTTPLNIYTRGWLLTHYLTFDEGRSGQLSKYLAAVGNGVSSLEAARQSFGDIKQLDRDLDAYLKQKQMRYLKIPADRLPIGKIDIVPLGNGEAAMMAVRIRSDLGVDRKTALAILPDARKAATSFANDAIVQAYLAEAEFDAGNMAEADAAADRALAADPTSRDALRYKGHVAGALAAKASPPDPAGWRKARAWYIKANRLDPNAAEPLVDFYDSFDNAGGSASANAVAGLERAFELAPEDAGVRFRLAREYLKTKANADARRLLAPLAFDPHRPSASATKAVTLIDAGKADEALATLSPSAPEPAASGS